MKVYSCIFTGTEVFCDNNAEPELVEGVVFKMKSRFIEVGGEDFGLAANVDEDAEEGATAEAGADEKQKALDMVNNNRLSKVDGYDKKAFMGVIKGYMKKILDSLPDDDAKKAFQGGAASFVKRIVGNFDSVDLYCPPYNDELYGPEDTMMVIAEWEDGAETPSFYFWKDGLKAEKV